MEQVRAESAARDARRGTVMRPRAKAFRLGLAAAALTTVAATAAAQEPARWASEAHAAVNQRTWDQGLPTWREAQVGLRQNTTIGPVIARFSHLERAGLVDDKVELEAYPQFRGGYLALGAGLAPEADLYPQSTLSGELFVRLPAQLELSGGYRRMNFSSPVDIVTGSLGAYVKQYLVMARVNQVLHNGGTAGMFTARRYFGEDGAYLGLVGTTGTLPFAIRTRTDFDVRSSRSIGADAVMVLQSRWVVMAQASVGNDEVPVGGSTAVTAWGLGFGVRF